MNAPTLESTQTRLAPLLARLEREHFPAHRLSEPHPGTVEAQFFQSRLTSVFQPVVRANDGAVAGHQGLLRVFDDAGIEAAPWSVFSQACDDAQLVQLDRLCRTVHALNYFPARGGAGVLFLNVEQRLLKAVSADHGAYFESILAQLGVTPQRVVIVLPASAVDDPVTFVRAAISYRIRGYRVLCQLRSVAETDLPHVFLADPHYVTIDMSPSPPAAVGSQPQGGPRAEGELRSLVASLARRGIGTIARRIQDEAQARAAREVGFGFLQGWHFTPGGRQQ
jgi:EAL domain-containing protein (putative c-di-GMP-specific phosphodiesterase class I)